MIRDILNLRSGENIVYEYINEDVLMVTGENAYSDGKSFLSFETGPTFKVGRVSSFRGLDKMVTEITRDYERNGLSRFRVELTDVN